MNESMKRYMRVGLVHFMAYPFAMTGEGDVEGTARRVMEDDYFDFLELTKINDAAVRRRVAKLAKEGGVGLAYGAQPQLMRNNENLNALDDQLRLRTVARMKDCIDEAYEIGAEGFAFLAGKYDAEKVEAHYQALCKSTRELCAYAAARGKMAVNLEVFDYDVEKCSLIGPAPLAERFAREISKEYDNFGLMLDLSHITQLHSSIDENVDPVIPYIRHIHIANAVLLKGAPAYGDQHPRFGMEHSEVDVAMLTRFLKKLFDIGYLSDNQRRVVSFEVKPWGDEDPEMVLAGAKRALNEAWAKL